MYLQRKDLTWDYTLSLEHLSSGIFALKRIKSRPTCSVKHSCALVQSQISYEIIFMTQQQIFLRNENLYS